MKQRSSRQNGFTLIELLIVVAIIGLLATLAIVALTSAQQRARDTKRVADLKEIQTALELYWNDNNEYPDVPVLSTWEDLGAELGPYLSAMPVDPDNQEDQSYGYLVDTSTYDKYYVRVMMEDGSHEVFSTNINAMVGGAGWTMIRSENTRREDWDFSCLNADNYYCLMGDSTQ